MKLAAAVAAAHDIAHHWSVASCAQHWSKSKMSASTEDIFPVSIRKLSNLVSPFCIKHAGYNVAEGILLFVLEEGDVVSVNISDGSAKTEAKSIIQQVNR